MCLCVGVLSLYDDVEFSVFGIDLGVEECFFGEGYDFSADNDGVGVDGEFGYVFFFGDDFTGEGVWIE